MKHGLVQFAVLIAAGTFSLQALVARAQNDPMTSPASSTQPNQPQQQQPGGSVSTQDSVGGPDANIQLMRDKQFLRKATEGGIADVELGKLAAQKGTSDDVKAFGQKMADDHEDMNKQIAAVADQMGFRLPKATDAAGKAEYDKLNALSGTDFDTEYVKYTSKANHEAFRHFRTEATTTTNADVRGLIGTAAPVIREHSMAIDKIGRDHGIEMPGRRPRPPAGATPPAAPPQ